MGLQERRALAERFTTDPAFAADLSSARTVEAAVRIAHENGIDAQHTDFQANPSAELGDAELEAVSGGTFCISDISITWIHDDLYPTWP